MQKLINGEFYRWRENHREVGHHYNADCWQREEYSDKTEIDDVPDIICLCGNAKLIVKYGDYEVNCICECGRRFNMYN